MKRNLLAVITASFLSLCLSSCGCTGPSGATGQAGPQGVPGVPGEPGKDGKDGERGPQGEPGTPGKDGKDGEPGPQGEPGTPGKDGKDGEPGVPGKDGKDGKDGEPGAPGKDGKDGQDGKPGPQGETGARGETGATGEAGADGKSTYDLYKEKYGYQGTEEEYLYDLSHKQLGEKQQYTISFSKVGTYTLPEELDGYKGIGASKYAPFAENKTVKNGAAITKPECDTSKMGYTYFGWFDVENPTKPVDFDNLRAYKDMQLVYGMIPDTFMYSSLDTSSTDGYVYAEKTYNVKYSCYNIKTRQLSPVDDVYRTALLKISSSDDYVALVRKASNQVDTKESGEFNLNIQKEKEGLSFERTYNVAKFSKKAYIELENSVNKIEHLSMLTEYKFKLLFDGEYGKREATPYEISMLETELVHSSGEQRCSFDINRGSLYFSEKDSTIVKLKTKGTLASVTIDDILLACDNGQGWIKSFAYTNLKQLTQENLREKCVDIETNIIYNFPEYSGMSLNDLINRGIVYWKSSNPEVAECIGEQMFTYYKGQTTIGLYYDIGVLIPGSEFVATVLLGEPRVKVTVKAPTDYKYEITIGRYIEESRSLIPYEDITKLDNTYVINDATPEHTPYLAVQVKDVANATYLINTEFTATDPRFEVSYDKYIDNKPTYYLGPIEDDVNLTINITGYKPDTTVTTWANLVAKQEEAVNKRAEETHFYFYEGVDRYTTELGRCDTIATELELDKAQLTLSTRGIDDYGDAFISTKIYVRADSAKRATIRSKLAEQFLAEGVVADKTLEYGSISLYYSSETGECFSFGTQTYKGNECLVIEVLVNARMHKDAIVDPIN